MKMAKLLVNKLNTRITFLRRESTRDEYGEPYDEWTPVKTVWASKFDLMGTDFYAAQTSDTKVEVKFSCRYTKDVSKDMRIQCGNEIYDIVGVPIDVDNKHRELLIYARLVNAYD